MARGLDHIVVAVKDLDAAARAYEDLGFTVSPENRHDWGTANRLIQLDGFFLEILTVAEPDLIPDAVGAKFSFGAFNRDFLKVHEGASMLVLESRSAAEDRADYEAAGLKIFDPFSFRRVANRPDGTTANVGFDLTFAQDPNGPGIGYFTCHNKFPENFWQPVLQKHKNGAATVRAAYIVAENPEDHRTFLSGFSGQPHPHVTNAGVEIETPRGAVKVLTQTAYRAVVGDHADSLAVDLPILAAVEIGCRGLEMRKIVPASDLFGLTLILSPLK